MTKKEYIKYIAKQCNLNKRQVEECLDTFLELIKEQLQLNGKFRISDLGTFTVKVRKAREGRNPITQKKMKIPEKKVVKFTPSKQLSSLLNP